MTDSQKNKNPDDEEKYLKDMKFNTLLFEQKLQKLKKKAKELQQKDKDKNKYRTKPLNRTIDNNCTINEKSKKLELNKQYSTTNIFNKNNSNITNNYNNKLSRQESKEIKSTINNEYSINQDTNTSMSNIYYTLDDDFFNDNSIRKDYKIRELIKKNKQLKNEIEYKDNIIENLQKEIEALKQNKNLNDTIINNNEPKNNNIDIIAQNKIDEINFELGKLTREIEEKNLKIENYEINNKNLNIKNENLMMQNKNLSNREKKLIEKNEYLITNLDKMKDDNENFKKKIMKLEKLKQNLLKDYEELSNDFSKLKSQKEKIESISEEQKNKILDLNQEIKSLHNTLEKVLNKQKQYNEYNDDSGREEKIKFNKQKFNKIGVKRYEQNDEENNYNNSDEYDNYEQKYSMDRFPINPNKTSNNFYPKNKRKVKFDFDEFDDNDDNQYINYSNKYSNKLGNKKYNTINARKEERRYSGVTWGNPSPIHQKITKSNYYDKEQEDIYNGIENDEYNDFSNRNYSTRNIFSERQNIKRKLGEYNDERKMRNKINGNQTKEISNIRDTDYYDYEGYEGFNCFPCERKQKKNKKEIDELNNDLNILLKSKNILENNLIKLPGQSKTINNIRQKKELNNKIKQTEYQINEIRTRLKQLKGI